MTPQEMLKEVQGDYEWVLDRTDGIAKKYAKVTRRLKDGDHKVLGTVRYLTPRKNVVIVSWAVRKLGKVDDIYNVMFFKYMTPRGYQYIEPINFGKQLFVYTSHSCDRMLERAGMTFNDYIDYYVGEKCHYGRRVIIGYEYDGKDCQLCQVGELGGFIAVMNEVGFVGVTFLALENYTMDQTIIGALSNTKARERSLELDEQIRKVLCGS